MRIQIGNEIIELKTPDIKGKAIVGIAFAILLVAAILTSFYTVKVEEEGVVMRFGKHVDTVSPGLHFKMPFGIDQVIPVPTKRQLTQEFGFETAQGARNFYKHTNAREMEFEKNMVTGDLNAVLVEWVVQYHIAEADNFLFRVRDPDETLRDASESIMRQIVGDRTVDEVITVGRQEIGDQSEVMLQELIALYGLGFEVDQVQLLNVDPPTPVQASFNEVNEAQQDKEKSINVANGQYNREVPQARGEAERSVSEAEGYATQRINEAEGDASRFNALFTEYQKASDVTRRRLYLETMEEVMPKLGRKVIIDEGANQVLPFLPLNNASPAGSN